MTLKSGMHNDLHILFSRDEKHPVFQVKMELHENKYSVSFEVHRVAGWDGETNVPVNVEEYLDGFIKWDGCSHFYFGEKEEKGGRDSYLHICGAEQVKEHMLLMQWLYQTAESMMPQLECQDPWEGRT